MHIIGDVCAGQLCAYHWGCVRRTIVCVGVCGRGIRGKTASQSCDNLSQVCQRDVFIAPPPSPTLPHPIYDVPQRRAGCVNTCMHVCVCITGHMVASSGRQAARSRRRPHHHPHHPQPKGRRSEWIMMLQTAAAPLSQMYSTYTVFVWRYCKFVLHQSNVIHRDCSCGHPLDNDSWYSPHVNMQQQTSVIIM